MTSDNSPQGSRLQPQAPGPLNELAPGADIPWRIERRENGTTRLIVHFHNVSDTVGDRVAAVLLGICFIFAIVLAVLPAIDRWWVWALLFGIAAFLAITHLTIRFGIVYTVVELPAGLVFHRYRSRLLAKVARHHVTEFGLVLSHPLGEGRSIGVYLSGRDGEFEIARFGPAQAGAQPWLIDHPEAATLRIFLAQTLNLRCMGVV